MAYTGNKVPPNSNANWRIFDPGDSVLKSVTRCAAMYELMQLVINAVRDYNAANTNQIPTLTLGIDADAREFNASGAIPFRVVVDSTTGEQKNVAVNSLTDYLTWDVPTTGELKDVVNPYDALIYMIRQLNRLNDIIQPDRLINDPRGLTTLTADETANEYQFTAGLPVSASVDATTGEVVSKIYEYGAVADLQYGILV